MCRSDKRFATKVQRRRRTRRGKNGERAVVKQAQETLESELAPNPDSVWDFIDPTPAPSVCTVPEECRIAAEVLGVHTGPYDDPRVTRATANRMQHLHELIIV